MHHYEAERKMMRNNKLILKIQYMKYVVHNIRTYNLIFMRFEHGKETSNEQIES